MNWPIMLPNFNGWEKANRVNDIFLHMDEINYDGLFSLSKVKSAINFISLW